MKFRIILTITLVLLIPFKLNAADNQKQIKVFDFSGNLVKLINLQDLDWFKIGDIAVADLGTDGIPEIILSAPTGEKPYLKIYRLNGSLINEFLVYPESYLGGVNFEIADLDNNGVNEIITAATSGGGPHILILDNQGNIKKSFFAFNSDDEGGVNISIGNLYEDSKPEIIVSSNSHNKVRVLNQNGSLMNELKLKNNFQHGQRIMAFDLGDDGVSEIMTYANSEDEPSVNIYQNDGQLLSSYLVFNKNFRGGINLTHTTNQLLVGAGFGGGPHLKIVDGYTNNISQFFTNNLDFLGGVKMSAYNNLIYTIPEQFPTAKKQEDKYILLVLSDQKLKYYQNGFLLGDYPISSGRKSLPTPRGIFSIIEKKELSYSKRYNLYMPYWLSFYPGYGIHELPYWPNGYREGQNHLGSPVSHGCVRLGIGPAEKLYDWAEVGTKVYIEE